jgi:methylated-DNA-[protein]-cysteine S-methyltransferase
MQERVEYRSIVIPSEFGPITLIWGEGDGLPPVRRVFLAREGRLPLSGFPGLGPGSNSSMDSLRIDIERFLRGEDVVLDIGLCALGLCADFRRRVYLAEHGIPRGWVSTYGRVAARIGHPGAARAVGTALAQNPFPIIVPCHRAIRANGELGGFGGGLPMKEALLRGEGVEFVGPGRVDMKRVYY